MKLHFLGANRQVTGSCYCLELDEARILVDCGMFQERSYLERNWQSPVIPARDITALLLTHAHLDHCGLIPRLVREGFSGPIYCTAPTIALAEIILTDSAKIQEEDAAYKRRRHERENRTVTHKPVALYQQADVERTMSRFRSQPYHQPFELAGGVQAKFHNAGHILGSGILELTAAADGSPRTVLFSGDIGQWDKPIVHDPELLENADYVVMESTYGDRLHERSADIEEHLGRIIHDTVARGGNVVIPTFAVERAQELLYYISRLVHDERIPEVPIFLDSPMAVDVTHTFREFREYFDDETWQLILADEAPLHFPGLNLARSAEHSKAINRLKEPAVIMASSGMCTGGRIKHHLRQNIERPESTILFVGFQGRGTLGRQILDRNEKVRIHGRHYRVRATVDQIMGFSAHADQAGLLRWIGNLKSPAREVFLTHGDEEAATTLATLIPSQAAAKVTVPDYLDVVELK